MRVAFLVSRFPNPSETWIVAQIEGLLTRGVDVDVVTFAGGEAPVLKAKWGERLAVHLVPVPKSLLNRLALLPSVMGNAPKGALDGDRFGEDASSLRLAIAAARWPEALKGDRVWLAHYGRWGEFACSLRSLGLIEGAVATMFHGRDMSVYLRKRRAPYARLFAEGDLFLPISERFKQTLIDMGAPADRVLVQRMGVDPELFAFTPRTRRLDEPTQFISVGRLVEKKGLDDAIDAMAGAPKSRLTIVGEGELDGALRRRAAPYGERVRFTGRLTHAEVAKALAEAHIFVLPSKTARNGDMEGIPVALMEAMAQGLPVISTRHSGIAELVEHGVSGLLCDEGDVPQLAANMAELAMAPKRWAAMGEAGAAKVRAEFNVHRWNDVLLERLTALAQPAA